MPNLPLEDPQKLRELAAWYRAYANRANAPWVCEGRLQTAEDLERAAAMLEHMPPPALGPGAAPQPVSRQAGTQRSGADQ